MVVVCGNVGCWGLACSVGINTQCLGLESVSANMPLTPHPYHTVVFFKQSSLFPCTHPIQVNCITFDAISRLSDHDWDLYWALGRCFLCKKTGHRSETCRHLGRNAMPLCSLLVDDPHREFVCLVSNGLWFTLSQVWMMSGWIPTLNVPMSRTLRSSGPPQVGAPPGT